MSRTIKGDREKLFKEFGANKKLHSFLAYNYKKISGMRNEELAFEFLRRNPLYIKATLECKHTLQNIKSELLNDNITKDDYLNAINIYINYTNNYFQSNFLYNPVDILAPFIKTSLTTQDELIKYHEEKNKKYAFKYSDMIDSQEITKKSQYDNLYNYSNQVENNYADNDAYLYKQKNSISMELLTNPDMPQRWLSWLRPSINIEINPYQDSETLKESFQALITLFSNHKKLKNVNSISSPNHLLDYFEIEELSKKKLSNKTQTVQKAAIKLFFYDMNNIIGIDSEFSFQNIQEIFEMAFKGEDFYDYVDFDNKNEKVDKNDYLRYLNKKAISYIKYIQKYIFGNYLDIVYPEISVEKHFYDIKDIYEERTPHKYKSILEYTNTEYISLNNTSILFKGISEKQKILNLIYRSSVDEIEDILN